MTIGGGNGARRGWIFCARACAPTPPPPPPRIAGASRGGRTSAARALGEVEAESTTTYIMHKSMNMLLQNHAADSVLAKLAHCGTRGRGLAEVCVARALLCMRARARGVCVCALWVRLREFRAR